MTYMISRFTCRVILLTVTETLVDNNFWGRVTQTCISKLIMIGPDNGLSPDWRQAILWTNGWVNWTRGNKHQWKFNRNQYIIIQEKSRPQCVKLNCIIRYCYNIFQYIILHRAPEWQKNMNQTLNLQKTPHTSCQGLWGVYCEDLRDNSPWIICV